MYSKVDLIILEFPVEFLENLENCDCFLENNFGIIALCTTKNNKIYINNVVGANT